MIAIVNTDSNWGIGKKGQLQVRISEDLKRFKRLTTNKVIIYGSKTLATYPGKKALPNRLNIVLSRNLNLEIENAIVCSSIEKLLKLLEEYKKKKKYKEEDFIVVGGASIYRALLPYCSDCFVTRIDKSLPADSFFPNLDEDKAWELVDRSSWRKDSKNNLRYSYMHYQRI